MSQIPRSERLRSDSASTPDNIWGFPSYAVREAFSAKSFGGFVSPLWNVLTEPIFSNYYTPKAGHAFESMEREYHRVGYAASLRKGTRPDGAPPPRGRLLHDPHRRRAPAQPKRVAFRSTYVHIAVGYPGLKMLPDLQEYREKYNDPTKVVNAYEPHEHMYQSLQRRQGTVLIRGSGIVASRVLQRLIDDRDKYRLQTRILHLFRTYVATVPRTRRLQPAQGQGRLGVSGLQLSEVGVGRAAQAEDAQARGPGAGEGLRRLMGGTNTPVRKDWQEQLGRGRREGWYHVMAGTARDLRPAHERSRRRLDHHPRPTGTAALSATEPTVRRRRRTTSSTARGWRPTFASIDCSQIFSITRARAATRRTAWTSTPRSS